MLNDRVGSVTPLPDPAHWTGSTNGAVALTIIARSVRVMSGLPPDRIGTGAGLARRQFSGKRGWQLNCRRGVWLQIASRCCNLVSTRVVSAP
jgi:hypothetical protein